MRVRQNHNIRGAERRPFHGAVIVSWQTRSGNMRTGRATCTDLSNEGARIECEFPIDVHTNVYLQAPAYGLMGNASVRYCRRNGIRHIIGLLFNSPASDADQGRKRLIRSQPGTEN